MENLCFLSLPDKIALVSLLIASLSLVFAGWSVVVGRRSLTRAQESVRLAQESLKQSHEAADRERTDWKQRKWFNLYVKTNDIYDLLNRFQDVYAGPDSINASSAEYANEFNELIIKFRELQMLAIVYPQVPPVKKIIQATTGLKDHPKTMFDRQRLQTLMEALQDLLEKAQMRTNLL